MRAFLSPDCTGSRSPIRQTDGSLGTAMRSSPEPFSRLPTHQVIVVVVDIDDELFFHIVACGVVDRAPVLDAMQFGRAKIRNETGEVDLIDEYLCVEPYVVDVQKIGDRVSCGTL